MESNRNNDELIRSKLDSYSVEPGNLNFAKVESGLKQAKLSAKSGAKLGAKLTTKLLITIGISSAVVTASVISYFAFFSAPTEKITSEKTHSTTETTINTSETISNNNIPNQEQNTPVNPENTNNINSTADTSSFTTNNEIQKVFNSKEANSVTEKNNTNYNNSNTNNSNSPVSKENKQRSNNPETKESNTSNANKFSSSDNKANNNNTVKVKNPRSDNSSDNTSDSNNNYSNNSSNPSNSKTKLSKGKESLKNQIKKTIPEKNIAGNSKENPAKEETQAETKTNPQSENSSSENTTITSNSKELNNSENNEVVAFNYLEGKPFTWLVSNNVDDKEISGNDSLHFYEPKKRSKVGFYISTEVSYNSVNYNVSPNTSYVNPPTDSTYKGLQQYFPNTLAGGFTANKYKFISGMAMMGVKYKNFGLESGVGFISIESKISTSGFGYMKPLYVIDSIITDTLSNPIDTTYKIGSYKETLVVNGDSTNTKEYVNNIRLLTIPINFRYCFSLYRNRLFLEPQVGVLLAIPLKSNQLVAIKPHEFEYSKNKNVLRKKILMYDVAVKLSYKITPLASLYVKQGYSFRNNSIYTNDYPIKFTLRNTYTSFGVTVNFN